MKYSEIAHDTLWSIQAASYVNSVVIMYKYKMNKLVIWIIQNLQMFNEARAAPTDSTLSVMYSRLA